VKVLFYLPVITPWWFDAIVEPLIRCLARAAEVHVLAPVPWSGTGIGERELAACADLTGVSWHIFDGDSHPSMRTDATDRDDIVEFVQALAPDYVLCRSADCATVRRFPGVVRHLMEGGANPLAHPVSWIVLQREPFDHGLMPALDADARAALDHNFAPIWRSMRREAEAGDDARRSFREWAGFSDDRPVLLLPLEYEHPENFYGTHRLGAVSNAALVAEWARAIDDRFVLAVTNHPLNELHSDNSAVEAEVAAHGARVRLIPNKTPFGRSSTMLLAREAQGMLLGDSKVYSMGAFFATPMLRRSRFESAPWLHSYTDLDDFLPAVANGEARAAAGDDARSWFAFHIANNLINPKDPELTPESLLAHIDRPLDPARWDAGFARYRAVAPEHCQ
jgi:hypothetical protein